MREEGLFRTYRKTSLFSSMAESYQISNLRHDSSAVPLPSQALFLSFCNPSLTGEGRGKCRSPSLREEPQSTLRTQRRRRPSQKRRMGILPVPTTHGSRPREGGGCHNHLSSAFSPLKIGATQPGLGPDLSGVAKPLSTQRRQTGSWRPRRHTGWTRWQTNRGCTQIPADTHSSIHLRSSASIRGS